ncbi:MAG: energy transducer TonB [Sphingomicrobium sp.]
MMYRATLDNRHKGGALAAVVAIHVAIGFALLHLSGTIDLTDAQSAIRTFDIVDAPPPPPNPPPPPPKREQQEKPKEKEGGSAPKNIRSEATPVVAPKPKIVLPPKPPIAASETPREGTAPTQGASDVRGPGTGAGGTGTGTGSGSGGSGTGGGGGGGIPAVRPTILRGISGRDYPRAIMRVWPRGAEIHARVWVEANGRPTRCDVQRTFGNPTADQWTCRLIMERGLFNPARDSSGRPMAGWYGYIQRG